MVVRRYSASKESWIRHALAQSVVWKFESFGELFFPDGFFLFGVLSSFFLLSLFSSTSGEAEREV